MAERRRGERDKKMVFRVDGDRLFLGNTEVFTSSRSLPDRRGDLLGYACSEGDYYKQAQDYPYHEALRDFGGHVQRLHTGSGQAGASKIEAHLERVYRGGSQSIRGPRG